MAGQLAQAGRLRPARSRLVAACAQAILLVGLVALTACQSVDASRSQTATPPRDRLAVAAADDAAPAPLSYPSLHTVPPRPRLSYSVQQRRTIVNGLVADRQLARYTDQVVRYRTGQSSLPPPPAPPHEVAAIDTEGLLEPEADPEPGPEGAEPAVPAAPPPYDDDGGLGGFDDDGDEDTLDSFVDDLARDPLREQADEAGVSGEPDDPAEDDEGGLLDWLGGLFGQVDPDPPTHDPALATVPAMQPTTLFAQNSVAPPGAPAGAGPPPGQSGGPGIAVGADGVAIEGGAAAGPASAPAAGEVAVGRSSIPPAPAKATAAVELQAEPRAAGAVAASVLAGRIMFAPESAELPAGAGAQLEQVLALAKSQGAVIRILGEASVPALALDRARAVGLALVRLGAGASDVEMTMAPGASGDQARLLLAGPGSR